MPTNQVRSQPRKPAPRTRRSALVWKATASRTASGSKVGGGGRRSASRSGGRWVGRSSLCAWVGGWRNLVLGNPRLQVFIFPICRSKPSGLWLYCRLRDKANPGHKELKVFFLFFFLRGYPGTDTVLLGYFCPVINLCKMRRHTTDSKAPSYPPLQLLSSLWTDFMCNLYCIGYIDVGVLLRHHSTDRLAS